MIRASVLGVVLLVACRSQDPSPPGPPSTSASTSQPTAVATAPRAPRAGDLVPPGTLRRATLDTSYLVVLPPDADVAALERLAKARSAAVTVTVTRVAPRDAFNDAAMTYMARPLPAADATAVLGAKTGLELRVTGPGGLQRARELAVVAREVADAARGWVLDFETLRAYPAAAFHAHVPGDQPDIRTLIVIQHDSGRGELPALDTAGLRRYGLTELYVPEVGARQVDQVSLLLNGVAQALLDGGDVDEHGEIAIDFRALAWDTSIIAEGTGTAVLTARWARDPNAVDDELVIELVPSADRGPEGLVQLIHACFGVEPDEIRMIPAADPELLAAEARARADLRALRARFAKGVPLDEELTIKAMFTDGDQVEWMWVDVVAFKGDTFSGTLANVPRLVTTVRKGQKVQVPLADVGDYVHERPGAPRAGGHAYAIIQKRGL